MSSFCLFVCLFVRFVCIVPEVMFGVEVASGDVHVTGFVCDLV